MTSAERSRRWRLANPEKDRQLKQDYYRRKHPEVKRHNREGESLRARNLRKRFGISLEQYEAMFRSQNGLCAICKHPERRKGKDGNVLPLCVDHDHETQRIRQLLCGDCNTAIGLMKDDVLRLNAASEYILRHRSV